MTNLALEFDVNTRLGEFLLGQYSEIVRTEYKLKGFVPGTAIQIEQATKHLDKRVTKANIEIQYLEREIQSRDEIIQQLKEHLSRITNNTEDKNNEV